MENTEQMAHAVLKTLPGADEATRWRVWHAIYNYYEGLSDGVEDTITKILGECVERFAICEWRKNDSGTLAWTHTGKYVERQWT